MLSSAAIGIGQRKPSRSASWPRANGCSSSLTLAVDERRHQRREASPVVALVGVDADPGVRTRLAHRAHALGVEVGFAGELQLDRARLGVARRAFAAIAAGIVGADVNVVSSGRGRSRPASCQAGWPGRLASSSHKRAVERVARAAGRQQTAQFLAVDARFDALAQPSIARSMRSARRGGSTRRRLRRGRPRRRRRRAPRATRSCR